MENSAIVSSPHYARHTNKNENTRLRVWSGDPAPFSTPSVWLVALRFNESQGVSSVSTQVNLQTQFGEKRLCRTCRELDSSL